MTIVEITTDLSPLLTVMNRPEWDGKNSYELAETVGQLHEKLTADGKPESANKLARLWEAISFAKRVETHQGKITKALAPYMTRPATNPAGEEILYSWPDISAFQEDDFEFVLAIRSQVTNLFFKVELGVFLICAGRPKAILHQIAREEVVSDVFALAQEYAAKVSSDENGHPALYMLTTLQKSLILAINSGNEALIDEVWAYAEHLFMTWPLDTQSSLRVHLDVPTMLTESYKALKGKADTNQFFDKCMAFAKANEEADPHRAIYICDVCLALQAKSQSSQFDWTLYKAQLFEKLADRATSILTQIGFVELALRLYKEAKVPTKVAELEERFGAIKGTGQFTEIKEQLPEDMVRKVSEALEAEIEASTPLLIYNKIAIGRFFQAVDEIRTQGRALYDNSLTYRIIGKNAVVDSRGNTTEVFEGEDEQKEHAYWQAFNFSFQVHGEFFFHYFVHGIKTAKLSYQTLLEFLEQTWLNEEIERIINGAVYKTRLLDVLSPGLKLLFSELEASIADPTYPANYVLVVDSLTVKIEMILREVCSRLGIPTFKLKDGSVVMEKLFDEILADLADQPTTRPGQKTGFNESDRQFIKFVFSEKMGWNLRNRVAHGLMDRFEYTNHVAVIVFYSIMRLASLGFATEDVSEGVEAANSASSV